MIEFYGGGVKWLLHRFPHGQFTMAFTLGHTVLGQTDAALAICPDHELVHVRQFERWGPFMGPAYLGCSLVLWQMGRRPYRDNPFERQAWSGFQCRSVVSRISICGCLPTRWPLIPQQSPLKHPHSQSHLGAAVDRDPGVWSTTAQLLA